MLAQALQVAQVDIPDTQVTALLRMIERDGKALDVAAFLDRFQVVYSSAAEQGLSAAESATGRRVRDLLTRVGRRLLQYHGNSRMKLFEQARAFPSALHVFVLVNPTSDITCIRGFPKQNGIHLSLCISAFLQVDTSGDGFVQEDEFCAMLSSLELKPPLSEEGGASSSLNCRVYAVPTCRDIPSCRDNWEFICGRLTEVHNANRCPVLDYDYVRCMNEQTRRTCGGMSTRTQMVT
jgi:hypothetical protein